MIFRLAADAMMAAHFLYIVFVVVGGFIAIRWRWIYWLHVPAVVWAVYVQFLGRICPLTVWEQQLRGLAGADGYTGGFIDHYLMPIIYPANLTLEMRWVFGTIVLVVNAAAYACAFAARHRAFALPTQGKPTA